MNTIEVKNLKVEYLTGDIKNIGLKEFIMMKIHGKHKIENFVALNDISFVLQAGDMLGIIGGNGAGKSTLLKVISGIMKPKDGKCVVKGNIAALLELASGFDGDLTVRENTFLRGEMLGYTKKFMNEKYQEIIDFAELKEFEDRPFRQLSSGMKSRLGFSISLALNPDIFIVDEALSVGDKGFAQKCMKRMMQLRDEENKTIFFISHSLSQVRSFCKTGMWIEGGKLVEIGDIDEVCDHYSDYVEKYNAMSEKEKKKLRDEKFAKRIITEPIKKSIWDRIFG